MGIVFLGFGNMSAQETVKINAQGNGETFDHFWSKCVGAGRANEALRAGWLEQMGKIKSGP